MINILPPSVQTVYQKVSSVEWSTPLWLFRILERLHGPFELDVAATKENSKCQRFFDSEINGLWHSWAPARCWMNPPYCTGIIDWIQKAYDESKEGAKVTCLLPAYTDRGWWHDIVMKHSKVIYFIRSKVSFGDHPGCAPFPSVTVVFDSEIKKQSICSLSKGKR